MYLITESRGIVVERAYCGSYMTSLEMAGIFITLLHLDDTIRRCLGKNVGLFLSQECEYEYNSVTPDLNSSLFKLITLLFYNLPVR